MNRPIPCILRGIVVKREERMSAFISLEVSIEQREEHHLVQGPVHEQGWDDEITRLQPENRERDEGLVVPEEREHAVVATTRIRLGKGPQDVVFVVGAPHPRLAILRIDRMDGHMVVRIREHRPGNGRRGRAMVERGPEIDPLLERFLICRRASLVEWRRLHMGRPTTAKECDRTCDHTPHDQFSGQFAHRFLTVSGTRPSRRCRRTGRSVRASRP